MAFQIAENHPLHRWFRGLTEHTFQARLGIADGRLVGYVAELLIRFVPADAPGSPHRIGRDRVLDVLRLLIEAESGDDEQRGARLREVGDYTLFWSGVFPEALRPRKGRTGDSDVLIDFREKGKKSYLLASAYSGDDEAPVLRRLSCEFELCAYGLSLVRDEWQRLDPPPGGHNAQPPLLLA